MDLKSLIRDIPDFPKPGILYRDITTMLLKHESLSYIIEYFVNELSDHDIDYVVAIESRGFIFGAPLALKLQAGFVPVRKQGKLPAEVHSHEYQLEYGTDTLEVHQDAIQPGSKVLIVDDVIATGGTAAAAAQLVKKLQADLISFAFIIELSDLNGRSKLNDIPVCTIVQY
ncbi:MAG: adenine phosphoribosyltransferase [Pseudomonadota bacterium]